MIQKHFYLFVFTLIHAWCATGVRHDVFTTNSLHTSLKGALPGDEIVLFPGTFIGNFYSFNNGTAPQKITIRSADPKNKAVISGLHFSFGEALYIAGSYWIVKDLVVTNAMHGIVFDEAMYGAIVNCDLRDTGKHIVNCQTGVSILSNIQIKNRILRMNRRRGSIRDGSSYFQIQGNTIQNTGLSEAGFGEGIYIGSDKSVHNV